MRIALLLGAEPKKIKHGPFVRLGPGRWKIAHVNVRDTTFQVSYIHAPMPSLTMCEHGLEVLGPCHIKVSVNIPGSEKFVSVYADSQ